MIGGGHMMDMNNRIKQNRLLRHSKKDKFKFYLNTYPLKPSNETSNGKILRRFKTDQNTRKPVTLKDVLIIILIVFILIFIVFFID